MSAWSSADRSANDPFARKPAFVDKTFDLHADCADRVLQVGGRLRLRQVHGEDQRARLARSRDRRPGLLSRSPRRATRPEIVTALGEQFSRMRR